MRLVVDTARCSGHGRCYTLAPELVSCDDDGFPILVDGGELPGGATAGAAARDAVGCCPEGALRLEDAV